MPMSTLAEFSHLGEFDVSLNLLTSVPFELSSTIVSSVAECVF
jgi:hypothetical protein